MLGRAGSWVSAASGGGASLTDARVFLYQDYAAGSGPNLTISQNDNGVGIAFNSANIINSSAAVTDTTGNPIYTSATEIPANIVAISSHTGASVTLTGTPAVGQGTVRIWYLYAMQTGDTLEDQELAPQFVNDYRSTYLDQQYLNTGLNLSDLTNAGTARTNLGFTAVTAGYVLLGDGSTTFTSDTNLFYDTANDRLGIGIGASPTANLHVVGTGIITTSVTVPIVYGSSSASGTLTLQSTSNATRGSVLLPDVTRVGGSSNTTSALSVRQNSDAVAASGISMQSTDGTRSLHINLQNNRDWYINDATTYYLNWSQANSSLYSGQTGGRFAIEKNFSDTTTDVTTPVISAAAIGVVNTSATANNYSGFYFKGNVAANSPGAGIVSVNVAHGASASATLAFLTRNAGTYARRMNIANDGVITMDAYTAGVAKFSAAGVISSGQVDLTTNVTGVLPVANGGTGQSSYTDGQLLIGNTTGNTLTKATLTAGAGISITNGSGSITIANSLAAKADEVTLSASSTTQAIVFDTAFADENYKIGWTFRNEVDADPVYQGFTVIAKANTGFTVEWNDALPSANYIGEWSATPYYNP